MHFAHVIGKGIFHPSSEILFFNILVSSHAFVGFLTISQRISYGDEINVLSKVVVFGGGLVAHVPQMSWTNGDVPRVCQPIFFLY